MALPATENLFGAIKTGIITITGQVLPVKYDAGRAVWRPRHGIDPNEGPRVEPHVIFGNGQVLLVCK
jgi:hypothetical protein